MVTECVFRQNGSRGSGILPLCTYNITFVRITVDKISFYRLVIKYVFRQNACKDNWILPLCLYNMTLGFNGFRKGGILPLGSYNKSLGRMAIDKMALCHCVTLPQQAVT